MSDMSFNQAKQLAERLEMTEVTLNNTLKKINNATISLDDAVEKQSKIAIFLPKTNKQLVIMQIILALNIGFICGLLISKYII